MSQDAPRSTPAPPWLMSVLQDYLNTGRSPAGIGVTVRDEIRRFISGSEGDVPTPPPLSRVIKSDPSDVHTYRGSRCATDPTTAHDVNAATVQPSESVSDAASASVASARPTISEWRTANSNNPRIDSVNVLLREICHRIETIRNWMDAAINLVPTRSGELWCQLDTIDWRLQTLKADIGFPSEDLPFKPSAAVPPGAADARKLKCKSGWTPYENVIRWMIGGMQDSSPKVRKFCRSFFDDPDVQDAANVVAPAAPRDQTRKKP